MDSLNELQSGFLTKIAEECSFLGDEEYVFRQRFDKDHFGQQHKQLIGLKWKKDYEEVEDKTRANKNKKQKFTDKLDEVLDELYKVFKDEGCPSIEKKKRSGRYPKGKSPWEQMYKWLWETKFPKWQAEQNNRMGADAALDDLCKICSRMIEHQHQATSNKLMHEYEDAKFEYKQIYVPLALVQRTKPDKRSGKFSPEEGTRVYEPQYEQKQRFEHEDFLTRILEQGKGKTNGRRIALIGEPGAGKTTFLQHIACWVSEKTDLPRQQETKEKDVAIRVSLAALGGQSLEEFLRKKWLKDAWRVGDVTPDKEDALVELFNRGRVWLLLDGVDEIASGDGNPRQAIADQMTGWVASARVVLTCRLNVWQANLNSLADFETYRLLDFDYPQQVHQFIDNWFATSDATKGERLKKKLGEAERIRLQNLVQNPLRLFLLCSIWRKREGELPQTKAGLYHTFVQQFYEWKQHSFPISIKEQQKLNSALGHLAKQDIDENGSRFWLRESYISEKLGNWDNKKFPFHLALKLSWLNDVGTTTDGEKVYAFFHPTFEEYFAALAINDWHFFLNHIPDNDPNHPHANYRVFEPRWKEVILLWLGREDVPREQKEQLIRALVEFEDGCGDFYWYRAYFLAAAGIAEFKDCSRADEIVQKIVEWGFVDFDEEQEWLKPKLVFAKAVRAILPETERTRAIITLERLSENCKDEYIRWLTADSLLKISPSNSIAIRRLIALIKNCKDEYIRWSAADSLLETSPSNSIAIRSLVALIKNCKDDDNRTLAVRSLVQNISLGDPIAIEALTEAIHNSQNDNSQNEKSRALAAAILGRINPGSSLFAIEVLQQLANKSLDKEMRRRAAMFLWEINPDNPIVITTLVELLQNSQDEFIRALVAMSLLETDPGHYAAIDTLANLIQNSQNPLILCQWAESLLEADPGNRTAIDALVDLSKNPNRLLSVEAEVSLLKIGLGNPTKTIKTLELLIQLFHDKQDDQLTFSFAERLDKINPSNPIIATTLVSLIHNSYDEDTPMVQDEDFPWQALQMLKKILAEDRMAGVVTDLKNCLSETYENNIMRNWLCYEVIWHCAQTLPYPTLYQAWHHPQLTSYPEVPEATGVGFTPDSQSLNLAELPKLLHIVLDSDSGLRDKVQLICINGSKFIDRDNPALKIYNEMQLQGCQEYEDGTPKTMVQLQGYWDRLRRNRDRALVLLFYENPTAPRQGFSETCLDALSRFDGAICAISDQPNIPLQSFSPNQPNLDINVVAWIRKIVLENP